MTKTDWKNNFGTYFNSGVRVTTAWWLAWALNLGKLPVAMKCQIKNQKSGEWSLYLQLCRYTYLVSSQATIQGLQVLHYGPWMLGSEIENPNGVHPPSWSRQLMVHVCCQRVRHGSILVWKQNSVGLTVFLEQCLVEKGLKSKCCRFYDLHQACSHQRPYLLWSYSSFYPCLFLFHTQRPQFPGLMSHW